MSYLELPVILYTIPHIMTNGDVIYLFIDVLRAIGARMCVGVRFMRSQTDRCNYRCSQIGRGRH